ncbi:hypothetical protein PoB_003578400 [Plakobranchus ocellatus]|uniref:Uncharacterized protein n=1 Tax=Plakobranchus ocellatus TaxID=259542 RepID=A0AAV4ASH2_9GAST|nr:hypothetical protein PoB_003578400 [Plakobranchus ocellatus]
MTAEKPPPSPSIKKIRARKASNLERSIMLRREANLTASSGQLDLTTTGRPRPKSSPKTVSFAACIEEIPLSPRSFSSDTSLHTLRHQPADGTWGSRAYVPGSGIEKPLTESKSRDDSISGSESIESISKFEKSETVWFETNQLDTKENLKSLGSGHTQTYLDTNLNKQAEALLKAKLFEEESRRYGVNYFDISAANEDGDDHQSITKSVIVDDNAILNTRTVDHSEKNKLEPRFQGDGRATLEKYVPTSPISEPDDPANKSTTKRESLKQESQTGFDEYINRSQEIHSNPMYAESQHSNRTRDSNMTSETPALPDARLAASCESESMTSAQQPIFHQSIYDFYDKDEMTFPPVEESRKRLPHDRAFRPAHFQSSSSLRRLGTAQSRPSKDSPSKPRAVLRPRKATIILRPHLAPRQGDLYRSGGLGVSTATTPSNIGSRSTWDYDHLDDRWFPESHRLGSSADLNREMSRVRKFHDCRRLPNTGGRGTHEIDGNGPIQTRVLFNKNGWFPVSTTGAQKLKYGEISSRIKRHWHDQWYREVTERNAKSEVKEKVKICILFLKKVTN